MPLIFQWLLKYCLFNPKYLVLFPQTIAQSQILFSKNNFSTISPAAQAKSYLWHTLFFASVAIYSPNNTSLSPFLLLDLE
jgi:hypothetical protein